MDRLETSDISMLPPRGASPTKAKAMAALREAIEKTGALKADPSDSGSPTFDELIASGKMPGNGKPDPEDLEKAKAARDAKAQ